MKLFSGKNKELKTIEAEATSLPAITGETDVVRLMDKVIDQIGTDNAESAVAALEKLVDLHDRVDRRNAEKDFYRELAEFRSECPQIKKSKTAGKTSDAGGRFGYKYADLGDVEKTVGKLLYKRGFSYYWTGRVYAEGDKLLREETCYLLHKNGHKISSTATVPLGGDVGRMNDMQKFGSGQTYAKRYSLVAVLGLPTTDEDTDGADPTTISESQAVDLEAKIEEFGADKSKFLELMGAKEFSEIRKVDWPRAMGIIKQKEKKLAGGDLI